MGFRAKASTGVAYRNQYVPGVVDTRLDAQYPSLICRCVHGFNAIHDQVQQDLLQLNTIGQHERESLRQLAIEPNLILIKLTVS